MAKLFEYVTSENMIATVVVYIVYLFARSVYRLYWSPLAKFPGPKLTAITGGVEFYHSVIRRGKFVQEIMKMHEQYGPIVRINPFEIHIKDPEFFDELFVHGVALDKYHNHLRRFSIPTTMFTALPHELHRSRRGAVAPFFSAKSVRSLVDVIWVSIEKLCARLEKSRQQDAVPIGLAFEALTTDIITDYAMGQSNNLIESPDFALDWHDTILGLSEFAHLSLHMNWLFQLIHMLPERVISWINPKANMAFKYRNAARKQVETIVSQRDKLSPKARRTIFTELLDSDLPESEKSIDHLSDEAQVILGAGSMTTAHVMAVMTFHLLKNPDKLDRLCTELQGVMPDTPHTAPSLQKLEALPYFTACIQESIRLSYGVVLRLIRVSRDRPVHYKEWVIPSGIPVGMSIVMMHQDETIFQNAMAFIPERWLDKKEGERLDRYMVSFSKGPRVCLGKYLAWTELYLTMAVMFHRFKMELFETDNEDVDFIHDLVVPHGKLESKGVRVLIH